MTSAQTELELFAPEVSDREVEQLVAFLEGRRGEWVTAGHYLAVGPKRGHPTEDNKRWVRALAEASAGRVCGGGRGYRLTLALTDGEYAAWRGAWLRSAGAIQERVKRADLLRATMKAPLAETV